MNGKGGVMIKGYLAVGNRCAVDFSALALPVLQEEALAILWRLGFRRIEVDLLALARSRIGVSRYRRRRAPRRSAERG